MKVFTGDGITTITGNDDIIKKSRSIGASYTDRPLSQTLVKQRKTWANYPTPSLLHRRSQECPMNKLITPPQAVTGHTTKIISPEARWFACLYSKASPKARRQLRHYVFAVEAKVERAWLRSAYHWAAFFFSGPTLAMQTSPALRRGARVAGCVVAGVVAVALLAGCSGDGRNSDLDALRGVGAQSTPTAVPASVEGLMPAQVVEVTRIIEATRIVEVAQPAQVVEIIVTATPDIAGFDMSMPAQDESAQPCPVIYWRNGRCEATQAQIEAYAQEKP
jgi:hypothetical protein